MLTLAILMFRCSLAWLSRPYCTLLFCSLCIGLALTATALLASLCPFFSAAALGSSSVPVFFQWSWSISKLAAYLGITNFLHCEWTVTELWLNGDWKATDLRLNCDWTVTELWLNVYWTVTEMLDFRGAPWELSVPLGSCSESAWRYNQLITSILIP